jgi:hypothetical protein
MRFSSVLISFLPSLSTSVAMAMEEPHDSVLHDVTASILEESIESRYKNKKSHRELLKIQNTNDGRPNEARDVELADDKGDMIHHLLDHQQHQEGKLLEECNIYPTTATTTAAAAATSDDDSFLKRKISLDKESITKMDYGHLERGTCSSPNNVCVPQNKAIEGNGDFLEPEDASYASSGYCAPLPLLEEMEYNNVVANTLSLIDKEAFNEKEEMTDSYFHYHPQYDHHHRQLDSLNCALKCNGTRQDVSRYGSYFYRLTNCYVKGTCTSDYPDISCWNTAGITEMNFAFDSYYGPNSFNDPLECWDVGQVTTMQYMFFNNSYFNQPIDSWNVSKVKYMANVFSSATSFNQPIGDWTTSQVTSMGGMFSYAIKFDQPIDTWDVSQVQYMDRMFNGANDFNQCLSTWAEKTPDSVGTFYMLRNTDCPNGIDNPDAAVGPWCKNYTQGCFAPGFEPSQQPSDLPSNSPTTKSQKKKSIKKTKKQDKKKSKKM